MPVQFQPKPGKPHIKIRFFDSTRTYFFWPDTTCDKLKTHQAKKYCRRVNPGGYSTPGEAARALHYGRKYI